MCTRAETIVERISYQTGEVRTILQVLIAAHAEFPALLTHRYKLAATGGDGCAVERENALGWDRDDGGCCSGGHRRRARGRRAGAR